MTSLSTALLHGACPALSPPEEFTQKATSCHLLSGRNHASENPNKIKGLCTTRPTFPKPSMLWAAAILLDTFIHHHTRGGIDSQETVIGWLHTQHPWYWLLLPPLVRWPLSAVVSVGGRPPRLLKGRQGGSDTRKQLLPAPAMTRTLPASTFPHPVKQMFFLAAGQSGITSHGSRHWLGILREVRLTLNFHFLIHWQNRAEQSRSPCRLA